MRRPPPHLGVPPSGSSTATQQERIPNPQRRPGGILNMSDMALVKAECQSRVAAHSIQLKRPSRNPEQYKVWGDNWQRILPWTLPSKMLPCLRSTLTEWRHSVLSHTFIAVVKPLRLCSTLLPFPISTCHRVAHQVWLNLAQNLHGIEPRCCGQ